MGLASSLLDLGAEPARQAVLAALSAEHLRRSLALRGEARVRLCSGSMRPILPAGAVANLRAVKAGETLRGAIVAVDAGERVLVHRVVAETRAEVTTRGIASRRRDPRWPRGRIIGVVSSAHGGKSGERTLRWAALVASVAYRLRHLRLTILL